jgi:outer membrane protein, heavy metal efflux system
MRRCKALIVGVAVQAAACALAQEHLPLPSPPIPAPEAHPAPAGHPHPAGQPVPQTLADFEGLALSGNPAVARSAALVQAARGNWVQVGLKPNPTVGYEGQQLGSGGLAEQHGVFAEQEFIRGGKLRLNREVAGQEVARAERELAAAQQRVLTDVRVAYYDVLVAQQQEQLAAELLRIAEAGVTTSEALLRAQEVGRQDVLQAQIEVENARILAINARNRRGAAWQQLVTVIGHPHMPIHRLEGDPASELPVLEFHAILERLLTGSPEIAASIADVERARWALERARVEAVPNVTVQGMVNVIDNGIGGKPDGNLVIGVPLPLWNKNQGGVIQAQGEVAAAERAVQQRELDLQNRLGPVFERYSNASNQVRRYQEVILPASRESYDLTRLSYEAGEVGFVNLLTAQRTFSQTRLNYLESLRELRTSAAQLEGFLLSGSLESR